MKTNSLIVLAAVTIASVIQINAQVLSPRAEANKTKVVAATPSEVDLTRQADGPALSPRAQAAANRVGTKCNHEGDTLAAVKGSRLSPRAQSQLGSARNFEVAALGTKSGKDCTSPCCKK